MKLIVLSQEKVEPQYYKVRTSDQDSCLVTGFTVQNATDTFWWPNKTQGAVRFSGEEYYSRFILNETDCDKTGPCNAPKTESGGGDGGFLSDPKTNFLAFSIFFLRVLFLKTIAFNILMTLKFWMS